MPIPAEERPATIQGRHHFLSTDEGSPVRLNAAEDKVGWKTRLEKGEINRFHSESEEGFLVSSGDERFWLVDHSGKLRMRCIDQCLAR